MNRLMTMPARTGLTRGAKAQRGVALVVALMILILISILGITAMRTSMFNAKIATTGQASTMAFQAAESAIAAVHEEALDTSTGTIIQDAMAARQLGNPLIQHRCIVKNNVRKKSQCAPGDYMDSRGLVKASSRTLMEEGVRPVKGAQLSRAGGSSTSFAWYDFMTAARGSVETLNIEQHNIQEFTRLGLYSGGQY